MVDWWMWGGVGFGVLLGVAFAGKMGPALFGPGVIVGALLWWGLTEPFDLR